MKSLLLAIISLSFLGCCCFASSCNNMKTEDCIKNAVNCRDSTMCYNDAMICRQTEDCMKQTKSCESTLDLLNKCAKANNCSMPFPFKKVVENQCSIYPEVPPPMAGAAAAAGGSFFISGLVGVMISTLTYLVME